MQKHDIEEKAGLFTNSALVLNLQFHLGQACAAFNCSSEFYEKDHFFARSWRLKTNCFDYILCTSSNPGFPSMSFKLYPVRKLRSAS